MQENILSKKNFCSKEKFEEIVDYEIKKTKRYNYVFCLVLFSIDNFDEIEDDEKDEILSLVLNCVSNRVRETDTFAKIENDEFSLLLPSTNLDEAFIAVEDLRLEISKIEQDIVKKLTASFGITVFDNSDTKKTLYNRANQAFFKAKENGKDRVEMID